MKILKLLFLVALLFGFALNSNAQSDSYNYEPFTLTLCPPCNGEDCITGTIHSRIIDHYNPVTEDFEWYKLIWKSTDFVSENTGEVFRLNGFEMGWTEGSWSSWPIGGDVYQDRWRNFIGDQGSHYLVRFIISLDYSTGIWTLERYDVKCL